MTISIDELVEKLVPALRQAKERKPLPRIAMWTGIFLMPAIIFGANYVSVQNRLAVSEADRISLHAELDSLKQNSPQNDTVNAKLTDLSNQVVAVKSQLDDMKIDVRDVRDTLSGVSPTSRIARK